MLTKGILGKAKVIDMPLFTHIFQVIIERVIVSFIITSSFPLRKINSCSHGSLH